MLNAKCYYQPMISVKEIYKKYNLHIQELPYSCGAVSLLNILHLKGSFDHTEESLVELCNARPGVGTDQPDLVTAVQALELLEVVEEKYGANLDDIRRHVDAGYYVIVNYSAGFSDSGHFAVVIEYDENAFYLFDSSYGFLRLENNGLESRWYNSDKTIKKWLLAIK